MARLNLHTYQIDHDDELALPHDQLTISLDSPALSVFSDSSKNRPLVINSSMSAVEAEKLIEQAPGILQFVVNSNNHFQGIINLESLSPLEFIKKTSNGFRRDELLISDFMIPRRKLIAFDLEEISHATVKDVLESFSNTGAKYSLVVDRENHKIRGVISLSEIEHKLNMEIPSANASFAGLVSALHR